jgi:hypothetical protein
MQPKEYFKNKARKLAKQTWAGPGKFGVFIVICIIVIAFFESLGLSNREKNLELRNVQNVVIPINYNLEKINEGVDLFKPDASSTLQEKLKLSTNIDVEKRNMERDNILLFGAIDQYLFEHQQSLENFEMTKSSDERTKYFLSLLLKEKEEILKSQEDDIFLFDI